MPGWYLDRFWAFLLAFVVTAALMPAFIAHMRRMRVGQAVREDGPQSHLSKEGTPTMGGVIILVGIVVSSLVVVLKSGVESETGEVAATNALLPVAALAGFGLLGFADDWLKATKGKSLGLNMWQKLGAQFLLSIGLVVVVWLTGCSGVSDFDTSIGAFGRVFLVGWLYWPFAVLLLVGMSNAVNIADGLDGLVAGLAAIAAVALMLIPVMPWNAHVPAVLAAGVGACLAFLWFNANPARIFMGDTGSLALGGFLAAAAIQSRQEIPFLIIGVLFIVEAATVALQVGYFKYTKRKYGEGRRIWKMAPLHHHYELSGRPEQKVVVRFWIVGILAAAIGVLAGR